MADTRISFKSRPRWHPRSSLTRVTPEGIPVIVGTDPVEESVSLVVLGSFVHYTDATFLELVVAELADPDERLVPGGPCTPAVATA